MFEGDYKVKYHMAPPLFAKKDAHGRLIKQEFGSWMLPVFKVLKNFKGLRGTALDIFGYTAERKMEARADRRVPQDGRVAAGQARRRQSRHGRGDRQHTGGYPRLRPREGTPSARGQREGGGAAGAVLRAGAGQYGAGHRGLSATAPQAPRTGNGRGVFFYV
jgi:hypothetical protein